MVFSKLLADEMYDGIEDYFEDGMVVSVKKIRLRVTSSSKLDNDKRVVEYAWEKNLTLLTQDVKAADISKSRKVKCILISFSDIVDIVNSRLKEGIA